MYFATDSGFGIWTSGVWVGDEWEWDGRVIRISFIGGRFVPEDVLELMVEDVSKMLESVLVGCVVTLHEWVVKTVWEVELVKLGADGDVSEDESRLSKFGYSLVFFVFWFLFWVQFFRAKADEVLLFENFFQFVKNYLFKNLEGERKSL